MGVCIFYVIGRWYVKGIDTGRHAQPFGPQTHSNALGKRGSPAATPALSVGFTNPKFGK